MPEDTASFYENAARLTRLSNADVYPGDVALPLKYQKSMSISEEIYENFTVKTKTKNKLDKELILKSLSGHFIFSSLIEDKSVH